MASHSAWNYHSCKQVIKSKPSGKQNELAQTEEVLVKHTWLYLYVGENLFLESMNSIPRKLQT